MFITDFVLQSVLPKLHSNVIRKFLDSMHDSISKPSRILGILLCCTYSIFKNELTVYENLWKLVNNDVLEPYPSWISDHFHIVSKLPMTRIRIRRSISHGPRILQCTGRTDSHSLV